jgi:hypothetical protein
MAAMTLKQIALTLLMVCQLLQDRLWSQFKFCLESHFAQAIMGTPC